MAFEYLWDHDLFDLAYEYKVSYGFAVLFELFLSEAIDDVREACDLMECLVFELLLLLLFLHYTVDGLVVCHVVFAEFEGSVLHCVCHFEFVEVDVTIVIFLVLSVDCTVIRFDDVDGLLFVFFIVSHRPKTVKRSRA